MFQFSYYANLATDDVAGCASAVMWHKTKNISANNEAMLLKLGRDVAPYETYPIVQISSPFFFKIKYTVKNVKEDTQ